MKQGDFALLLSICAIVFIALGRTADRFTATDAEAVIAAKNNQAAIRDEQLSRLWAVICVEHPQEAGCARDWQAEIDAYGTPEP